MNILLIFMSAFSSAIGSYVDKTLTSKGISRKDYFFYMCFSMLPFALLMMVFENKRFELSIVPALLLLISAVTRYISQHSIVGIVKNSEPYQYKAYVTMAIILTFIIDNLIGTQNFNIKSILSIILTVVGGVIIANFKLQTSGFKKDVMTRIVCGVVQGYITFYILKYWSNAIYIFILNLTLTITFMHHYTVEYHKQQKNIIKWVFAQQTFGFIALYITNILMSQSVTLGFYITPVSIVISVLLAYFLKDKNRYPKSRDLLGIILVVLGIILLK